MVKRLLMAVPPKDHNGVEFPYVDVRIWELKDYDPISLDVYNEETGIFNIGWSTTFAISYYRINSGTPRLLTDKNLKPIIEFFYTPKYIDLKSGMVSEQIYTLFLVIKVAIIIYDLPYVTYSTFGESWLTTANITQVLSDDSELYPPDLVAIYLQSQGGPKFQGLTVVDV